MKFLTNHHQSQAMFRALSSKQHRLELSKIRDMRFFNHFIILERYLLTTTFESNGAYQLMVLNRMEGVRC